MTTAAPALPTPYDQDAEHLRILSICWYVLGGIKLLLAMVIAVYMGIAMVFALAGVAVGAAAGSAAHDPTAAVVGIPFAGMGILFLLFFGFLFLLTLVGAYLDYECGRSLQRRRRQTFCFVVAILACMNLPFGTVLGVFTLIVLGKPQVKAMFV